MVELAVIRRLTEIVELAVIRRLTEMVELAVIRRLTEIVELAVIRRLTTTMPTTITTLATQLPRTRIPYIVYAIRSLSPVASSFLISPRHIYTLSLIVVAIALFR